MAGTTVIVSGLPRSGTSMMMRMLDAGGLPLLVDAERPPDTDNPLGYYEFAPVKRLREDASWMPEAAGRAVKVLSFLLPAIPPYVHGHIIFMERDMEEVLASQRAMVVRRATAGAVDASKADPAQLDLEDARLRGLYARHLESVRGWMGTQANLCVLYMAYGTVLNDPQGAARQITDFLNLRLDEAAMARAVEPGLYRQHRPRDGAYPKISP
ncbi:MAG: sulfotransferase [Candidatus Hydrogenedentes bacterium]|nr:sulfotransferase [Candidatus Hydrogenedentota bacterium]